MATTTVLVTTDCIVARGNILHLFFTPQMYFACAKLLLSVRNGKFLFRASFKFSNRIVRKCFQKFVANFVLTYIYNISCTCGDYHEI
jgi:hypothetical protein